MADLEENIIKNMVQEIDESPDLTTYLNHLSSYTDHICGKLSTEEVVKLCNFRLRNFLKKNRNFALGNKTTEFIGILKDREKSEAKKSEAKKSEAKKSGKKVRSSNQNLSEKFIQSIRSISLGDIELDIEISKLSMDEIIPRITEIMCNFDDEDVLSHPIHS